MKEEKLISAIIPVYNGEHYVVNAIESILKQTYHNIEIIVVDDGSTDATVTLIKQFPKVKYFFKDRSGPAASRNMGVKNSSGDYLAFLDADDQWLPNKIELQIDAFSRTPELDYVLTLQQNILKAGCKKPHWLKQEFIENSVLGGVPTLMVKRTSFDQVGFFSEECIHDSDFDWFFRAKDLRLKFEVIQSVLFHRLIHDKNYSNDVDSSNHDLILTIKRSINRKNKKNHESNKVGV